MDLVGRGGRVALVDLDEWRFSGLGDAEGVRLGVSGLGLSGVV